MELIPIIIHQHDEVINRYHFAQNMMHSEYINKQKDPRDI